MGQVVFIFWVSLSSFFGLIRLHFLGYFVFISWVSLSSFLGQVVFIFWVRSSSFFGLCRLHFWVRSSSFFRLVRLHFWVRSSSFFGLRRLHFLGQVVFIFWVGIICPTFINNFLRFVSCIIRNYPSFLLHFAAYFPSPLCLKPSSLYIQLSEVTIRIQLSEITVHYVLLFNCSIVIWAAPPAADALAQLATDCTSG